MARPRLARVLLAIGLALRGALTSQEARGADPGVPLERLSVDHRKPAPGSAAYLDGREDTKGTEAAMAPVADVPQTEFRAGRFNVGSQLRWFKDQYFPKGAMTSGAASVDMDTVDQGHLKPNLRGYPMNKKEGKSIENDHPAFKDARHNFFGLFSSGRDKTDADATAAGAAMLEMEAGHGPPEYGDILPCGKPPELKGQSLRVCVPFGGPLPQDQMEILHTPEDKRGAYDKLAEAQNQRRFGGATPPVVVASIETSAMLHGRFVVNVVSVYFDHFEAVISRIDDSWSWTFPPDEDGTGGATLWLDWYAYGFKLPQKDREKPSYDKALARHQDEADAVYNEPLRKAAYTLPQQAHPLDMLNPQTHLDPFVPEARDNPMSARHAYGAVDSDLQDPKMPKYKGMHGFDSEAVAATERADCDKDTRLAQARTYKAYLVGIKGAPGYKPTPAWAKLTGSKKDIKSHEGDSDLKKKTLQATGGFDTQQELPMPWRPKLDPKRDDKDGGFYTGEAKQQPSESVAMASPQDSQGDAGSEPIALERAADTPTGFDGLVLADGEHGTMQASWTRRTARPVLWKQGPGEWPQWCSLLDTRDGTVACGPPVGTAPGERVLNVTAVGLDALKGLSQEVFLAPVNVVGQQVARSLPASSASFVESRDYT